MSENVWKVRLPFRKDMDAIEHGILTLSDLRNLIEEVIQWLKENDRLHHLVMVYDNDRDGVRVTLNNPDTALMLKLALG